MGYKTKGGSQKVDLPDLDVSTGTVITGGVIIIVLGAGVIYAIPWLINAVAKEAVVDPWSNFTSWWERQQYTAATVITGGDEGWWPDAWWPN